MELFFNVCADSIQFVSIGMEAVLYTLSFSAVVFFVCMIPQLAKLIEAGPCFGNACLYLYAAFAIISYVDSVVLDLRFDFDETTISKLYFVGSFHA